MLNENLINELNKVLKGVKILSRVKNDIESKLSTVIDKNKVRQIFNEELSIGDLNDNEQTKLLNVIYEYAKDERFNPTKIDNSKVKVDYSQGNTDLIKKDDIPELYYDFLFKKEFASQYTEDTKRVVMALFRKTAIIENEKGKDLYSFNKEELADAIKSLKAKTIRSLQDKVSTVERYIDFAKDNGKTKINYATLFDSKDKLEELVDKEAEENMIFDRDEIMAMAMGSDNAQDGVILGLLFDGVSHKNEFDELINLTEDNIDEENQQIVLEGREEPIPMSTETAILVRRALEEDTYVSITGENSRKYKIAEGVNVLRGLRGKNKVKGQIISQRILRVAEIFDYPYLNATTISYSGQLHLAKHLINIEKKTINEAILAVLDRFSIPNNNSSQFSLRNRIEKYLKISK